ncbi:MAG: type I secretion system permease/ATPase [Azonexus sp.]|nr:type I secretion system permease/ATPase [Betaproteobacteria bacterium]MBK8919416.1 type I secretion system permease/ATPase [Betaproteobacteria bacterium]MBP6037598.1 type I secretion system permease/ATPase [Azonexus sp.]MBP6907874.1 type I secretion system permease/ATPase [Azonexus sp.]
MQELLRTYRHVLVHAGVMSFFLNLLLLAPTLYMLQVFDRVFTSRSDETLFWLTAITVGLLALYLVIDWMRGRLLAGVSALVDRLLGETVMLRVLEDAASPTPGRLAFLARDAGILRSFFGGPGIVALLEAPWLPFFIVVIYLFHPLLGTLAVLSALALVGLAVLNFRLTQKPLESIQDATRKAGRFIDVGSRNAEVVKALGMYRDVVERWGRHNREALRQQNDVARATSWLSGGTRFARQLIQVLMLAAGAYLVIDQHVTPGVMMATTLILGRALAPVEQLIAQWKLIGEARVAYRRLDAAFTSRAEKPKPLQLPPLKGEVVADRVSFGIRPGQPAILKGVSFNLAAGEFLGVIGPSGSGKSTLVRLLTGVWSPQAGAIRLDGAEVGHWDAEALGRQIGYLPQDIELFPGTVAENIARMGPVDDAAVIEAAQAAGVHSLILGLPEGYATEIGINGENLSGGQRQRVALARALYGRPQLVVLDEPNANLDADGDQALLASLDRLKQAGVTAVMVCHKPSLLARADRLLILKEGAVAAFGPREEILAKLAPVTSMPQGDKRGRA